MFLYINHENKAIYLHNPKVAGTYIHTVLEKFFNFTRDCINKTTEEHNLFNENSNLDMLEKYYPCQLRKKGIRRYVDELVKRYPDYFKFTFVRNPYSKMISAWSYGTSFTQNNEQKYLNTGESHIDDYEFDNFLQVGPLECTDYTYFHSFITQTDHLINSENEIDYQFIGRYENLKDDLLTVLKKLNFTDFSFLDTIEGTTPLNYSIKTKPNSFYLTPKNITIINNLFKQDFINFNYTMKAGIEDQNPGLSVNTATV